MKRVIRVLISPNAFRDCLSPMKVAKSIRIGFRNFNKLGCGVKYKYNLLPIADGGDGFLEVLSYKK